MVTMALNAVPALARMSGIDNPRNRGASRKTTLNITVGAIIAPDGGRAQNSLYGYFVAKVRIHKLAEDHHSAVGGKQSRCHLRYIAEVSQERLGLGEGSEGAA